MNATLFDLLRWTPQFVVGCLVSVVGAPSLPAQAYPRTALTDKVDTIFDLEDDDSSPGYAVGIFKDGRIIYARGYGLANLEYEIPMTPQTVFRIASMSKQFTAMCIALLAEQGKLSLDDDIRKFFPEMPEYESPITVRHLVNHTSGMRDYMTLQGLVARGDYYNSEDALAMLLRQRGLRFNPGERYSYSNSGYFFLAALVERVSGMKTSEFAREHVFEPLGMTETHFHDDLNVVVKNRASGYRQMDGGYRIHMTPLDLIGDGGIYTTIEDYFKWDQNFYENKLGKSTQDLIETMLTPGVLNSGEEITYALGLNVSTNRGLRTVSHSGSWVGFNTYAIRYPDQRFSVVAFSNGSRSPGRLVSQVADLYLADQFTQAAPQRPDGRQPSRRPRQVPAELQPISLLASQVQEYSGFYYSDELDAYAVLSPEEGALTMRLGMHSGVMTAFPSGAFRWRRMSIEFVRGTGQSASALVLNANPSTFTFTRVQ